MSANDIRKLLENLNEVGTLPTDLSYHDRAIDLIHDCFKLLNDDSKETIIALQKTLMELSNCIEMINSGQDTKKKNELESLRRTMWSIAKQLDPDIDTVKAYTHVKLALKTFLRKLYQDVIASDTSFEQLAKTNKEAKSKIEKLAKLILLKTSDQEVKHSSTLIVKQAKQIQ